MNPILNLRNNTQTVASGFETVEQNSTNDIESDSDRQIEQLQSEQNWKNNS
jgi:hypothetical protein